MSRALPHGSSRHSPSDVSSALVLVPFVWQRTGVQVGDGGELWDEKEQATRKTRVGSVSAGDGGGDGGCEWAAAHGRRWIRAS